MDSKKAYEAFRVRKFAQPHPAFLHSEPGNAENSEGDELDDDQPGEPDNDVVEPNAIGAQGEQGYPDHQRVILHFDCDCFYAQVEEVRNPALRQVPLGVTQKYLIVTCNYLARAAGVTKLMGIKDAVARCPELVLVSGEDLGPYRQASKSIHAVLSRYGPAEKLGMDETFVDATEEVHRRVRSGAYDPPAPPPRFVGHLHTARCAVAADTSYRPQDLRAVQPVAADGAAPRVADGLTVETPTAAEAEAECAMARGQVAGGAGGGNSGGVGGPPNGWVLLLTVGSIVAAEARAAVRSETGFRSSAGIAHNKMLAKLISGLHKPDDQTTIMPDQALDFVAPLAVRALPGVGYKTEKMLTERLGAATAADVRRLSRQQLIDKLGDKTGALLWHLCRGQDPAQVRPSGPPRSITVEDSFKSCASWTAVGAVLRVLAPDLLQRLHDEYGESRRRPDTLTLKWRLRGTGWSRSSASCAMPLQSGALSAPPSQTQVEQLVRSATQVLQKHLKEPFNLSLINLGATNFKTDGNGGGGGGGGGTILDLFSRCKGTPATGIGGSGAEDGGGAAAAPGPQTGDGGGLAEAAAAEALYGTYCYADEELAGYALGDPGGPDAWGDDTDLCGAAPAAASARPYSGRQQGLHGGGGGAGGAGPAAVGGGGGGGGVLSPAQARRAAEQSAALRRNYHTSDQSPIALLSKSRERQLREEAAWAHQSPARGSRPGSTLPLVTGGAGGFRSLHAGFGAVLQLLQGRHPPAGAVSFPRPPPAADNSTRRMAPADDTMTRTVAPSVTPTPPPQRAPDPRASGPASLPVAPTPSASDCGDQVPGNMPAGGAAASVPKAAAAPAAAAAAAEETAAEDGGCGTVRHRTKRRRLEGEKDADQATRSTAPCSDERATTENRCDQGSDLDIGLSLDLDLNPHLDPAVLSYRVLELYGDSFLYDRDGRDAAYGDDGSSSSSDGGGGACLPYDDWVGAAYRYRSGGEGPYRSGGEGPLAGGPVSGESPLAGGPVSGEGPLVGGPVSGEGPLAGGPVSGEGPLAGGPVSGEGPLAGGPVSGGFCADEAVAAVVRATTAASVQYLPSTTGCVSGPPDLRGAATRLRLAALDQQGGQQRLESRQDVQQPSLLQQKTKQQKGQQEDDGLEAQQQQQQQQRQDYEHGAQSMDLLGSERGEMRQQQQQQQQQERTLPVPQQSPALLSPQPQNSRLAVPRHRQQQHKDPRQQQQRQPVQHHVMLHVDVDCFYCQVERLDDPSLAGKPLAVTQFNSGGFVAVSYEARAAGIRCGDGVGAGGRAAIPYLQSMGAVSLTDAQRRCPGLVVRPMRTERYRQVAEQVHGILRRFAPDCQVEKTSYDDFYLDVTALCQDPDPVGTTAASTAQSRPPLSPPRPPPPPPQQQQSLQQQGRGLGPGLPAGSVGFPLPGAKGGPWLGGQDSLEAWFAAEDPDAVVRLEGGEHEYSIAAAATEGVGAPQGIARTVAGRVAEGAQGRSGSREPDDGGDNGACAASSYDSGGLPRLSAVAPPPRVHVAGGGRWSDVELALRRGVEVAQRLRAALQDALSFTVSVGVGPTKLSARLAGPANKPDAVTVVPVCRLQAFMAGVRIKSVPTLAGKTGTQVVSELGIELVGQLIAWPRRELVTRFGPQTGALLADLPYGGATAADGVAGGGAVGGAVRERGPQKSILVERSFPPITRFGGVKEALEPMLGTLWERVVEDAVQHKRAPNKLLLTWRQGYGAPKTKSADVPVQALQALKAATAAVATAADARSSAPGPSGAASGAGAGGVAAPHESSGAGTSTATAPSTEGMGRWTAPGAVSSSTYQGCRALLEGAAAIFKAGLGSTRTAMQITRLAVAVGFGGADSGADTAGQRTISAFATHQRTAPGMQHQRQQHQQEQPGAAAPAPALPAVPMTPRAPAFAGVDAAGLATTVTGNMAVPRAHHSTTNAGAPGRWESGGGKGEEGSGGGGRGVAGAGLDGHGSVGWGMGHQPRNEGEEDFSFATVLLSPRRR